MTLTLWITAQTDKAVCHMGKTWIARSQMSDVVELDLPSKMIADRVAIPMQATLTEKAIQRAGF